MSIQSVPLSPPVVASSAARTTDHVTPQTAGPIAATGRLRNVPAETSAAAGAPVSYTHLDVYKRQTVQSTASVSGGAGTSGIGNVQVTETSAAGESGTGSGAAGKDVAGAFGVTVNGVITWEAATGTGQDLTGNSGNANTDGLRLRVTATTTGEHGTVVLTRGIGETLDNMLDFLTGSTGSVTSATDTLNKQIDDLKKEIQSKTDRITAYEEKLRLQFIELETNMGRLQNQGSYLATQFAALTKSK